MTQQSEGRTEISEKAVALLRDLAGLPQSCGYNHEIKELDDARLIYWKAGEGYAASDKGREYLLTKAGM